MATTHHLACDCGATRLEVRGEPALSAYCHCVSCREMYGVELLSASTWSVDAVRRRTDAGTDLIAHRQPGRRMWRYHCSACGRLMHGRNRRGEIVIPNERFRAANDGALPAAVTPTEHIFYDQRVLDVADDLPRHPADRIPAYSDSPDD